MRKIIVLVAMTLSLSLADSYVSDVNAKIYFMPYEQDKALKELIDTLKNAKKNISIAVYSFTNKEIAKALRDASSRGVSVQIIYDHSSNHNNNISTIGYLAKYKNIYTCTLKGQKSKNGKYDGIMHHKLAIIDSEILVLGSANWSKNAFENNYENLLIAKNPSLIAKANDAYKKMLQSCQLY